MDGRERMGLLISILLLLLAVLLREPRGARDEVRVQSQQLSAATQQQLAPTPPYAQNVICETARPGGNFKKQVGFNI